MIYIYITVYEYWNDIWGFGQCSEFLGFSWFSHGSDIVWFQVPALNPSVFFDDDSYGK